jgi:cell division transport system ATP-binding protein
MIEFRHVYKTYAGPTHALKDVNFKVEKGEFIFLTGPSGAGKTTLFRMLSAFDRPTSGQVFVGQNEVSLLHAKSLPFFRSRIGVVFQDFRLLKTHTVFENVALPLRVRSTKQNQIDRRVEEVLEQVGLGTKRDQLPEILSGGEQQRVAIARAMIHRPGLLIADEPTGNLDPEKSEEIIDLLEDLCDQGTTVIIATHDHNMVARRKKRRINLYQGEVAQDSR